MNDPLDIVCLRRQIGHHSFVVLVLADETAREGMPDRPENRRKMAPVRAAQPPGLIEKALHAMPSHRRYEPLDEGRVDLGVLLERLVAKHRDDKIHALY